VGFAPCRQAFDFVLGLLFILSLSFSSRRVLTPAFVIPSLYLSLSRSLSLQLFGLDLDLPSNNTSLYLIDSISNNDNSYLPLRVGRWFCHIALPSLQPNELTSFRVPVFTSIVPFPSSTSALEQDRFFKSQSTCLLKFAFPSPYIERKTGRNIFGPYPIFLPWLSLQYNLVSKCGHPSSYGRPFSFNLPQLSQSIPHQQVGAHSPCTSTALDANPSRLDKKCF
jgi:hypothetical protein